MSAPQYEVYAIKYAHHARTAKENFLGGDPHDGPMPMDYFVWLVRGAGREIVVDTGFNEFFRVVRGGCWHDEARACRSAFRFRLQPTEPYRLVGVRVVCVVK